MFGGRRGLAVLVSAAALTACGGSDEDAQTRPEGPVGGDQRGVLATIDALQTASRRGDGQKICNEIFTPQLARSVAKASDTSCPVEVGLNLFGPGASIAVQRGIEISGSRATAVIREQSGNVSTLRLLKQAGQWRINQVIPRGAS